jgi:hypothetical protein
VEFLPNEGVAVSIDTGARRIFRSVWILAANGIVVGMTFTSIFGEPLNPATLNRNNYMEFSLKAVLPVVGIALELAGSKFARWVNVGYLAASGLFFCEEAIRWWSDPYHGVLLLMGIGLLMMAGLTEIVYRISMRVAQPLT